MGFQAERKNVTKDENRIPEEVLQAVVRAREEVAPWTENPISPTGRAVVLKKDATIDRGHIQLHLQSGKYIILDDNGSLGTLDIDELAEELTKAKERAEAEGRYSERADESGGQIGTISGTVELNLSFSIVGNDSKQDTVTYLELLANIAKDEAKTEADRKLIEAALFRIEPIESEGEESDAAKTPSREPVVNDHVIMPITKADNIIFNPCSEQHIMASDYNGDPVTIATGKGAAAQLSLFLAPELNYNEMTMAERAEYQLTEEDRFWLRALQSIVYDNPDETRVYGTDILKRWGWANPYAKNSYPVMAEALKAVRKMRVVSVAIDTTKEQGAYKRNRGKVVRSVQERPIVDCLVTVEEVETKDGKSVKDFHVDLRPKEGKDATDALPTLGYALEKGQLITADSSVFVFDGVEDRSGKTIAPAVQHLTKDHRRMAAYVYAQAMTKKTSNVILYSTMFTSLGIEMNKHRKSRAHKKVCEMLENWKARGIIGNWWEKMEGARVAGVVVEPPKKKLK